MKTFAELMEQIPHMVPKQTDLARVRANELAKRQFRRHVHGEIARTAAQEVQDKKDIKTL
jgi:hypothetical protein